MRNLKRALSLMLSAALIIGMMVISAGAVSAGDFTDADEITNEEAVSVLASLGVITGKDDGSYDPAGTITRAEMTTIICRILNGGTDPNLSSTVVNTFSDTANHWAAGYIEFCVASGIVAGRGDGTFDPDGTVTVAEGAKMMLVALGYYADVEGLTGANWQINTDVLANQKGLYNGMSMASTSENLTRDNAAQMGYNLLDLNTISYDYIIGTDGSTVTTQPQAKKNDDTVLEEYFNAVRVEGVVTGNEMAVLNGSGSHLDAERTRINVTNYGDGDGEQDAFSGNLTIVSSTGLDELGRTVDVFVKASSSSSRATIIGSVIVTEDNTVVTDYSGDALSKVADDNNLNLVPGSTLVAQNYGGADAYSASTAVTNDATRGVEKILIDNDGDSDLDYVLMNTYSFGKVTSYITSGDGSIVVSTKPQDLTASDKDDVVGFDDVAKDDYVIAAKIGGRVHVEKAESVTGSLDSYRVDGTNSTKLEVDGTNYDVSWIDGYTAGTDDIKAAKTYGSDTTLDVEATFYLGKGGYVVAVGDAEESAYNYALVMATGSDINDQVKVMLSDGTIGTYTLSSSGVQLGSVKKGQVYSYTLSGSTIKLTAVASENTDSTTAGNYASFSKGKTAVSTGDTNETSYATANTVFFYVDGTKGATIGNNDVDVYTGYNAAPSLLANKATADVYRNSSTRAVAVVFWGDGITTGNVEDLIYLTSTGNKNSDRMLADAFIAGSADLSEDVEIALSGNTTKEIPQVYTVNADGYYELSNVDSSNIKSDVTVISASSSTFVLNDGSELKITSDTLLIDDSDYLDDPTAELGAGPDLNDKLAYVVYTLDGSTPDEAKMVVVKNTNSTDDDTTGVISEGGITAPAGVDMTVNTNEETRTTTVKMSGTNVDATVPTADISDMSALFTGSAALAGDFSTSGKLNAGYSIVTIDVLSSVPTAAQYKITQVNPALNTAYPGSFTSGTKTATYSYNDLTDGYSMFLLSGQGASLTIAPLDVAGNPLNDQAATIIISNTATFGEAPAPSVSMGAATSQGATVDGSSKALTAGQTVTAKVTGFDDGTSDSVKFTVTPSGSETISNLKVKVGNGTATDYTGTTADNIDLGSAAGEITVVITLTSTLNGTSTDYTYTVTITAEV